MDSKDIVIVSAVRTAIGGFNGSLASVPAVQLGAIVIKEALERAHVAPADVTEVIMGQVLTGGAGQNPARQAAIKAGIPHDKTAITINQVCGSGLRAVALAAQAIQSGNADIMVAGGQENMSRSPHVMHLRSGVKMGNAQMTDSMITDGLWDAFNDYHMGITAENLASKYEITRADQDAFAARSQQKAATANEAGKFRDEIIPVTIKGRKEDTVVAQDEDIRPGTTVESIAKLKPAFKPDGGTVTAASSSGINDGAAALVLMTAEEAQKRGLTPLARIAAFATAGVDPAEMGYGPVPAVQAALAKAGWTMDSVDLIEANEAFAAQALTVGRALKFDDAKLNVNGGAIALGHPIGASGARVLTTLLHEMGRRDAKRGLATLCIGGGMGVAMLLERA